MRGLNRLAIPPILEEKGQQWTINFVDSGKERPPSSQYAHKQVRDYLLATSNYKCFYCERSLKNIPAEVDHYLEVAEYKHLAFLWQNLYGSCDNCNDKKPNKIISCMSVLDPCSHSDGEIEEYLTFEDEQIVAKNDSLLGSNTIKKYKLNSPVLDLQRARLLNKFKDFLLVIKNKQIAEGRNNLTSAETDAIKSFASAQKPFSLMMKILLIRNSLYP